MAESKQLEHSMEFENSKSYLSHVPKPKSRQGREQVKLIFQILWEIKVIQSKNVGQHSLAESRHLTRIWNMPSTEAPISAPLSSEVPSSVSVIGVLLKSPRFTCAIPLPRPRPRLDVCCVPPALLRRNLEAGVTISTLSLLLQLFRGLPTNLISDLPLPLSSWTPSFILLLESLAVPTPVLALLTPSQFVVLPRCLLRRYFHYLHSPQPPIFKRKQCL
jgi:hypothetical protein